MDLVALTEYLVKIIVKEKDMVSLIKKVKINIDSF